MNINPLEISGTIRITTSLKVHKVFPAGQFVGRALVCLEDADGKITNLAEGDMITLEIPLGIKPGSDADEAIRKIRDALAEIDRE